MVIVPEDPVLGLGHDPSPPQLIVPAETFQLEQALTLKRAGAESFVVLTKLADKAPGFDIYEYVQVG